MDWDKYLYDNNTNWLRIVDRAIQDNISVKDRIDKMVDMGHLPYITEHEKSQLIDYIYWEVKGLHINKHVIKSTYY